MKQNPGCLPRGYTLDSMLTVGQFATWQQKSVRWVRARLPIVPGVIRESRQHVRIHPRTYLELRLKHDLAKLQ